MNLMSGPRFCSTAWRRIRVEFMVRMSSRYGIGNQDGGLGEGLRGGKGRSIEVDGGRGSGFRRLIG